ncbi:TLC domain-containing protein [Rutstroemia sp. NJR-2017a WRK4]|nr:TLC domain-containing protein [Rutstroemia sp. NJR-2017a WRK4]
MSLAKPSQWIIKFTALYKQVKILDPFPPCSFLATAIYPIAEILNLRSLPLHIHEVVLALFFYTFLNFFASSAISSFLFPNIYPNLPRQTKISWNIHFVSLIQSIITCALALCVRYLESQRWSLEWRGRLWGYTGAGSMVQAFSAGYFLWDLGVSIVHFDILGWSSLLHAICALAVVFESDQPCVHRMSKELIQFQQRPFTNYYGLNFVLYELSTPFLNIHWFCDKLNITGARIQLYNGIVLIITFFSSRLVWGTYPFINLYIDIWTAFQGPTLSKEDAETLFALLLHKEPEISQLFQFVPFSQEAFSLPIWLARVNLGTNVILIWLNCYWFGKMIGTVLKRFKEPGMGGKRTDVKVD